MSRSRLRRCAAPGCQQYVEKERLMCITHWRLVPRQIKSEINAAYRERGANPDAAMTQRYADALVAAVNAVRSTIAQIAERTADMIGPESEPMRDQWFGKDPLINEPPSLAIYSATEPPADDGDVCADCDGRGGTITGEMQGDPDSHRTSYVEFFESCGSCVDAKLCPGCSRPAPTIDADNIDAFTCAVCGWSFDRSRFDHTDPNEFWIDFSPVDTYDYTRDDFNFDADRERRSK